MGVGDVRALWRHGLFRKLVAVRVASQAADGTVQVGMASYVLFSPQSQPNAWAIAAVLAVTLLPFSVVGPFVSIVLDRWSRRQVVVVVDAVRCVLTLAIAGLVAMGGRALGVDAALFGCLLLVMSLNRFAMAGLTAGLGYTVDEHELLTASSIVPTIGPLGLVIGAGLAGGGRLSLGAWLPAHQADAVVFCLAAALFVTSVTLALRIPRMALGPEAGAARASFSDTVAGLVAALRHLGFIGRLAPVDPDAPHPAAARLGLIVMGAQRFGFGFVMVAVILGFRNHFHHVGQVKEAMADLSLWAGLTGIGFVSATLLVPQLTARLGLRRTVIGLLVGLAVVQVVPGAIFERWTLLAAGVLLGLLTQSVKICVDTLVQAHVDARFKGRAFVIYDMIFNVALVASAVVAALVLPPGGLSVAAFVAVAAGYGALALGFAVASVRVGAASFERGLLPPD